MICPKEKCNGCFACYNICPKKAIKMNEDEYGNIYPSIDTQKCINCGLCKKVCPSINNENINFEYPHKVYAMYSKDINLRANSTSGGIATSISKYIIEKNGIVYGAGNLFNNNSFNFCRIDNKEDLYKIQGSKYVHCYIQNTYTQAKKDLNNKKIVLFIGTPCQIAGLKKFLLKDYENLITIDIICHGVPSQKLLFEDIQENFKRNKNDFEYITFRDSKGYHIKLYKTIEDYKKNRILNSTYANLDQYYKNFLRGNIYRDNCYICPYARKERISDITIGDFWGLDKNSKIYDNLNKGISCVLISTEKGQKLINEVSTFFKIEERTYKEVYIHNKQLNNPMKKSNQFLLFKKLYHEKGYKTTFKKMNLLKDYIKYNPIIYNIAKKLKLKF